MSHLVSRSSAAISRRRIRQIFVLSSIIILYIPSAAEAAGNAMPLSKEHVVTCAVNMQKAIDVVTPEEQQRASGDFAYAKDLITRMVVQPISQTGCDYDATVFQLANVIANNREPSDRDHRAALGFLFISIYSSSDHLLSYGFISRPTHDALNEALARLKQK